jgi:hypothetical protein
MVQHKKENKVLSKKEMKDIVDEIIELGNELRRYNEFDDELAKTGLSPDITTLDSFKKYTKGKVPPSYVQLMSIYNGIENFEYVGISLLSMEYIIENDPVDENWVDAEWYEEGEIFIFIQSDSDDEVVAFLIKTASPDGEMKVVHFDTNGPLGEYSDLEAYLKARRDWFRRSLENAKADREGLSDDD